MTRRSLIWLLALEVIVAAALPFVAWIYSGPPARREPDQTRSRPAAVTPSRSNDGWLRIDHVVFVDTQGNFVDAGQMYIAQRAQPAIPQPMVHVTYRGIMYKLTIPGWQIALRGGETSTPAFEFHPVKWSDVAYTTAGH